MVASRVGPIGVGEPAALGVALRPMLPMADGVHVSFSVLLGWMFALDMMQEDLESLGRDMTLCTCVDDSVCPLHGDVSGVDWSSHDVAWKRTKWMRRQPLHVQWGRRLAPYHRPPLWWSGCVQPLQCEDLLRPGYRVGYMRPWIFTVFQDGSGLKDHIIGFSYPRWLSSLVQGWYGYRRWRLYWYKRGERRTDEGYQESWRDLFRQATHMAVRKGVL